MTKEKNNMMLFGSALKENNKHFEKINSREPERTLASIKSRVTDCEGMDDYEVARLGLIYNRLAPDDTSYPISAKMVKEFMEKVREQNNPDDYEKICSYFDYENPKPEKYMKKLGVLVENIFNKYRTVEYCYMYSKSFREFVEKYASVVDADGLSNIEKIKWLRLWLFIIKDQGFFWTDEKKNGRIYVKEQRNFDHDVYLFPNRMLCLEKYILKELKDKSLNVEMLKRFIKLYPEKVQKEVYVWAELKDGNTSNMLRAGEVRMGLKRKLFPIKWMSPMSLFCINDKIKENNPKYLEAAIMACKKGGVKKLKRIEQRVTDPFDSFKEKTFKGYEVYDFEEDGIQKVLVVNSEFELKMFEEVGKWLLKHPYFKFGTENKTIYEYGLSNLLMKFNSGWFFQLGLVDTEDDINWECFDKILEGNEEYMDQYIQGKIEAKSFYESLGFTNPIQAKLCCNKRMKLLPVEAHKMTAALKRIKMFGAVRASKSDNIYLEYFKYMMSERKEELPKNIVNLYGNFIK